GRSPAHPAPGATRARRGTSRGGPARAEVTILTGGLLADRGLETMVSRRSPMLRTLIVAVMAAGLAAPPAAQGKGKATGKSKDKNHPERGPGGVVFTAHDRQAVRTDWIDPYGRGNCPPGLGKKNNGCMPPGQAKKRYVIGPPLPPVVVIQPLP